VLNGIGYCCTMLTWFFRACACSLHFPPQPVIPSLPNGFLRKIILAVCVVESMNLGRSLGLPNDLAFPCSHFFYSISTKL